MLKQLFQLLFPCMFNERRCQDNFFGCKCGKGDEKPATPQYKEDPATAALKRKVGTQVQGLLDTPYEDYVQRFTPSAETQGIRSDITNRYQGLLDTEDYSLESFEEQERAFEESVQGQYSRQREEGFDPIRERLIAENLYDSGPGFAKEAEYAGDTAQGSADITASLGRESIDRKFRERSYQDALQRGDYSTMYNLALSEGQQELAPQFAATEALMGAISAGSGLFGEFQQGDTDRFNAEQRQYETALQDYNENRSDFGGLGTALGIGAGLLLAPATGGASLLVSGALGGAAGQGLGSMFEY